MKYIIACSLFALATSLSAQVIKDTDNIIACLATNTTTSEKAIISWANVDYDRDFMQTVGVDEKRVLMDKNSMDVLKVVSNSTDILFSLSVEREVTSQGTFSINKKTGKGILSKNLMSSGWDRQSYWLFPLSTFTCRSTKSTPGTTFRANSFLRSLGLPAIDSTIRYSRVGCGEFDFNCGTVKID